MFWNWLKSIKNNKIRDFFQLILTFLIDFDFLINIINIVFWLLINILIENIQNPMKIDLNR